MNNEARKQLIEIVKKYGVKILDEPRKVEVVNWGLHFPYLTRDRIRKSVRAFLMIEKKSKTQLFFRPS